MKIISNGDSYADALSTAAFATIPFIAMGMTGLPVLEYVSEGLCILFLLLFLIRFALIVRDKVPVRSNRLLDDVMSLMQLPYVVALAAAILFYKGIDATSIVWIAVAFAIGTIPIAWMFKDDESFK